MGRFIAWFQFLVQILKENVAITTPPAEYAMATDRPVVEERLLEGRTERIKQTLSANLEEYKSLRAEYSQHLTFQHQALGLTFLLAGALLTASPTIIGSKNPAIAWLLVVSSLIFVAISWVQLRYLEANVGIRNYIISRLTPRVQKSLRALYHGSDLETPEVFYWESEGINRTYVTKDVPRRWLLPILFARIFLSLIASMTSIFAFLLIVVSKHWTIYHYNDSAILIVAVLILFTIYATKKVYHDVSTKPVLGGSVDKTHMEASCETAGT